MLAVNLGEPADIATILGAVVVVGGLVLARTNKFRSERRGITTLVAGRPAVFVNGVEVEAATPGLGARQDKVEATLEKVVARLDTLDHRLTPNGLNTTNPGDVLARTEAKVDDYGKLLGKVIDHLGIDTDDV